MDICTMVTKFANISNAYAEADDKDRIKHEMEAKNHVKDCAKQLETYFKTKFVREKTGFIKNKQGVIMPCLNIQKMTDCIVNNTVPNPSQMVRYKTTIDTETTGMVFLMDYSGSMWIEDASQSINSNQRIFIQNFVVLTLTHILQSMQKTKVFLVPMSQSPILQESTDIMDEDWNLFLVHKEWGSDIHNINHIPKQIVALGNGNKEIIHNWLCSENPDKAIDLSYNVLVTQKIKKYSYMIFTDGGLDRDGETTIDKRKFIKSIAIKINKGQSAAVSRFIFIMTQDENTKCILDEVGQKYNEFNNITQLNDVFKKLSNTLLETFNNV